MRLYTVRNSCNLTISWLNYIFCLRAFKGLIYIMIGQGKKQVYSRRESKLKGLTVKNPYSRL